MAERITRPSNAAAHPEMVDRNPTHCSKEEAQAEKEAIAMAKAQAAMGKKAKIEKLATIEKAEKQKAKDMDREADDPVGPLSQARARMSRKQPVEVDEMPTKRMRRVVSGAPTVEHNGQCHIHIKLLYIGTHHDTKKHLLKQSWPHS
jgi:hypothetical protein